MSLALNIIILIAAAVILPLVVLNVLGFLVIRPGLALSDRIYCRWSPWRLRQRWRRLAAKPRSRSARRLRMTHTSTIGANG